MGDASSVGLALGALDAFGTSAPWVHVMKAKEAHAGRVQEALATAATGQSEKPYVSHRLESSVYRLPIRFVAKALPVAIMCNGLLQSFSISTIGMSSLWPTAMILNK